jgi:hypothetical protein
MAKKQGCQNRTGPAGWIGPASGPVGAAKTVRERTGQKLLKPEKIGKKPVTQPVEAVHGLYLKKN